MSLPELFYHENLFVGCLAIRRLTRHKTGDTLKTANTAHTLSAEDADNLAAMAQAQLFTLGTEGNRGNYDFSIMTQAMDYESLRKCPALGSDHHCAIHHNRKPTVCSMVPFDALYPDSLQNIVLMSRQFEENCIVAGQRDDYQIVVKNRQVISEQYHNAIKQRRDDLHWEKQYWGNAVFTALRTALFTNPAEIAKIPINNGLVLLSIIPVLQVLADVSDHCRTRCLQYVDRQIALIDSKIAQAILRKTPADKQTTQTFRLFKEKYVKIRPALAAATANEQLSDFQKENVENYLAGVR
jgi:Fe-S-cluster containining protein